MNRLNKIKSLIVVIATFVPQIALGAWEGIVRCSGNDCNFLSFIGMINDTIDWIIKIAISIGAVSFAYAGSLILLNPGNSGKRSQALEIFKKTLIGIFVLLCSWLIVNLIMTSLTDGGSDLLKYIKNK